MAITLEGFYSVDSGLCIRPSALDPVLIQNWPDDLTWKLRSQIGARTIEIDAKIVAAGFDGVTGHILVNAFGTISVNGKTSHDLKNPAFYLPVFYSFDDRTPDNYKFIVKFDQAAVPDSMPVPWEWLVPDADLWRKFLKDAIERQQVRRLTLLDFSMENRHDDSHRFLTTTAKMAADYTAADYKGKLFKIFAVSGSSDLKMPKENCDSLLKADEDAGLILSQRMIVAYVLECLAHKAYQNWKDFSSNGRNRYNLRTQYNDNERFDCDVDGIILNDNKIVVTTRCRQAINREYTEEYFDIRKPRTFRIKGSAEWRAVIRIWTDGTKLIAAIDNEEMETRWETEDHMDELWGKPSPVGDNLVLPWGKLFTYRIREFHKDGHLILTGTTVTKKK